MIRAEGRVAGIDWAAQPAGRAAAVLSVAGAVLRLELLEVNVGDAGAAAYCRDPNLAAVGVDVPFGWPAAFAAFVAGWRADGSGSAGPPDTQAFRYRVTDRYVRDRLGKIPLSVSSDLISLAARSWVDLVHAAGLGPQLDVGLAEAPATGPPLIEVYPGAALAGLCGSRPAIRSDGYKRDAAVRVTLLQALRAEFHLETGGYDDALIGSGARCDGFDALVAALVTAVYAGMVPGWRICRPGVEVEPALLRQEGWVYFPLPDEAPAGETERQGDAAVIPAERPQATQPPKVPLSPPPLDPEGRTAGEVVNRRVLCPGCRDHVFQRWPFGWDAHSHRCSGLRAGTHVERKAEFRSRYRHLFR